MTVYYACGRIRTMAKELVNVRIDPAVLKRIDALAEREGVTRTEIFDRLIDRALPSEEAFVSDLESPVIGKLFEVLGRREVAEVLAKALSPFVAGGLVVDEGRLSAVSKRRVGVKKGA